MRNAWEKAYEREREWERTKAEIEYRVANRPLLVELNSKAFCAGLLQMRELERYVQQTGAAHLDPAVMFRRPPPATRGRRGDEAAVQPSEPDRLPHRLPPRHLPRQ